MLSARERAAGDELLSSTFFSSLSTVPALHCFFKVSHSRNRAVWAIDTDAMQSLHNHVAEEEEEALPVITDFQLRYFTGVGEPKWDTLRQILLILKELMAEHPTLVAAEEQVHIGTVAKVVSITLGNLRPRARRDTVFSGGLCPRTPGYFRSMSARRLTA